MDRSEKQREEFRNFAEKAFADLLGVYKSDWRDDEIRGTEMRGTALYWVEKYLKEGE